jgi:hypothetical protein
MEQRLCAVCGKEVKAEARFCTSCGADLSVKAQPAPSLSKSVKKPLTRKARRIYGTIVVALFGLFLYLFVVHLPGGAHPVIANQPEVAMASMYMGLSISPEPIQADVDGGRISFPLSTVQQYHAVSFEIKTPTGSVPLLAYISPEGKLVTSIRMCEPCNSKNFRIEGTELACGNCETRWKLNNLEGIQGTCQKYPPDPIPSIVEGNKVIIEESVIRNWKMRI